MPQRSRVVKVFIVLGTIFGISGGVWLMVATGANRIWKISGGLTLIAVWLTAWGMWELQHWALWTSRTLAVLALSLGCYLAFYMLSFGPFPLATRLDRSMFVLYPLFLIFPIIWLIYFSRPGVRAQFRGRA